MRIISLFEKKQIPKRMIAFRQHEKKKKISKFFIFSLIFLIILLASSFYLIFFSPIFKIKFISFEIKDYPLVKIDEQQLKNEINKILSKKFYFLNLDNIFFFPKKEIKNLLLRDQKIENFEIKRNFNREIKIKISAWKPEVVFLFLGDYFLLNKNGEIIKKISQEEVDIANLPIVENKVEKELSEISILSVFDFLKKTSNLDFKILKIEINEVNGALIYQAFTSENWKIYFDPKGDIKEQVRNLLLILKEKITDRKKLEYIDLRFSGRIFYK